MKQRKPLTDIRAVRCRHFKRRFAEGWEFNLSPDDGLMFIKAIFTRKTRPAVLIVKPIRGGRLQIRALCPKCALNH